MMKGSKLWHVFHGKSFAGLAMIFTMILLLICNGCTVTDANTKDEDCNPHQAGATDSACEGTDDTYMDKDPVVLEGMRTDFASEKYAEILAGFGSHYHWETVAAKETESGFFVPVIDENATLPNEVEIPSEGDIIDEPDEEDPEEETRSEEEQAIIDALRRQNTIVSLLDCVFVVNQNMVDNYLNVRNLPNGDVIGKLYPENGGRIVSVSDGWVQVVSGNLSGWVKEEYIVYGEALLCTPCQMKAVVQAEKLFLRSQPSANSNPYRKVSAGEYLEVLDIPCGGWVYISYEEQNAYVCADFVSIVVGNGCGLTLEEDAALHATLPQEEEMTTSAQKPTQLPAAEVVLTELRVKIKEETRYIGSSLTAADFSVYGVFSDGHKEKLTGWYAEPLTLTGENNAITVIYGSFQTTVMVPAISVSAPTEPPVQPTEPPVQSTESPIQTNSAHAIIDQYRASGTPNRAAVYLSDEDIRLLATVIRLESGYEPAEGKLAVANVVLNRLLSGYWGSTLSDVIYAPGQFSIAKKDENGISKLEVFLDENRATPECYEAAYWACAGYNNIGGYIFFCNIRSADQNNKWPNFKSYYIIGNHVFYSKN